MAFFCEFRQCSGKIQGKKLKKNAAPARGRSGICYIKVFSRQAQLASEGRSLTAAYRVLLRKTRAILLRG